MKNKILKMQNFLIAIFAIGLVASVSLSQPIKIGYVNSAKILQEYPEAQEAQKKLDNMGKAWQAELEKMSKELQKQYEDYQKQQGLMTEQKKLARQQELLELEQKFNQYRSQKFGSDGELAEETEKLLQPIKDKVMKVIQQVAKDEKLTFIFDRNETIMVLLYGDPAYDYTYKVLDKLKRTK